MHHLGWKFRVLNSEVLTFFFPHGVTGHKISHFPSPSLMRWAWFGASRLPNCLFSEQLRPQLEKSFNRPLVPETYWCNRWLKARCLWWRSSRSASWQEEERHPEAGQTGWILISRISHDGDLAARTIFQNVSWKYSKINFLDIISCGASMSTSILLQNNTVGVGFVLVRVLEKSEKIDVVYRSEWLRTKRSGPLRDSCRTQWEEYFCHGFLMWQRDEWENSALIVLQHCSTATWETKGGEVQKNLGLFDYYFSSISLVSCTMTYYRRSDVCWAPFFKLDRTDS